MKKTELDHEKYMQKAIYLAQKASAQGEVPIGAIVVNKSGLIIGRGYNKMEQTKCQTGHAEITAIKKACKKIGDWRLNDCWIYVTLEPCIMCFGLIQLSRISGIVFGVKSPLFGFGYKKEKGIPLFKKDLIIKEGVKKKECKELLQQFFKTIRKKKEK